MISAATLCYTANGKSHRMGPGDDGPFSFSTDTSDKAFRMRLALQGSVTLTHLSVQCRFASVVQSWRDHDYRWVDVSRRRLSQFYSPKLLRCDDGLMVAGSHTTGVWEIVPGTPDLVTWHLIHPGLCPLPEFVHGKQRSFAHWEEVTLTEGGGLIPAELALLGTHGAAQEWSRSPKGFGATVCLTDHCDFDTLHLLKAQRELFARHDIRVTKGFFTHHFSKREDNCSFEKPDEREEFFRWQKDGHELFCHGLSQSVKSPGEAIADFEAVEMPVPIRCWVDHGFQYYNFTQRLKYSELLSRESWFVRMREFGVSAFWNYLDSGESTEHCSNQLDPYGFVPQKTSGGSVLNRLRNQILNVLYYYTDETRLHAYRRLAGALKALSHGKLMQLGAVVRYGLSLVPFLLYCLMDWKALKHRPSRYTAWAPFVFSLPHSHVRDMCAFQTIAIKHFPNTFSRASLDTLVNQCGAYIGHTYFSVLEAHHTGRLFRNASGELNTDIDNCLANLSHHIAKGTVWNPTISELIDHYRGFGSVCYTHDESGDLVVQAPKDADVPMRPVS